jgi:phosphohistidine phosphatase SixA
MNEVADVNLLLTDSLKKWARHYRAMTMTTYYLIRHAEALAREAWSEGDSERPLTPRGERQAAAIARQLKDSGLSDIRTSTAMRCRQTVIPLASLLNIELQSDPALYEGGAALQLPSDGGVHAWCSHGDIIPATLDSLRVRWEKCGKGSIWKLTLDKKGNVRKAEYTPPPE